MSLDFPMTNGIGHHSLREDQKDPQAPNYIARYIPRTVRGRTAPPHIPEHQIEGSKEQSPDCHGSQTFSLLPNSLFLKVWEVVLGALRGSRISL